VFRPLRTLAQLRVDLAAMAPSLERALRATGSPARAEPARVVALPRDGWREIRLQDVTFAYDGRPPVLSGVDLTIGRLQIVAVTGPNGAGKSTLLRLVAGAEAPASGFVGVDDVPAAAVRRADDAGVWFGYVPQDAMLFQGSIRDNVCMGRPVPEREVIEALERAGAAAYVFGLEDGLDTAVGHSGWVLSTGWRQRVSIARALVGDPPVLLLDEPVSAVDRSGLEATRDVLSTLRGRTTILFVTHRGELDDLADVTLAIEDGAIREVAGRGTGAGTSPAGAR
jgi:ABC-type bacteriocin/lantibiotic exporter with double-glycine peptidase domain